MEGSWEAGIPAMGALLGLRFVEVVICYYTFGLANKFDKHVCFLFKAFVVIHSGLLQQI